MKSSIAVHGRGFLLSLLALAALGGLAFLLIGASARFEDLPQPWTTVASAGAVDEGDRNIYQFTDGVARVAPSATLPRTLDIRYNVVAVDGHFAAGDGYVLTVRYKDNGSAAHVIVRLREYNLNTGVVTTRITFDSNDHPQSDSFQVRSVPVCSPDWAFDFLNNAYFVEAQIIKTSSSGDPALGIIQVSWTLC